MSSKYSDNRRRNMYTANCACGVEVLPGAGWLYQDTSSRKASNRMGNRGLKTWKVKCDSCHTGTNSQVASENSCRTSTNSQKVASKRLSVAQAKKLIKDNAEFFRQIIKSYTRIIEEKSVIQNFVFTFYKDEAIGIENTLSSLDIFVEDWIDCVTNLKFDDKHDVLTESAESCIQEFVNSINNTKNIAEKAIDIFQENLPNTAIESILSIEVSQHHGFTLVKKIPHICITFIATQDHMVNFGDTFGIEWSKDDDDLLYCLVFNPDDVDNFFVSHFETFIQSTADVVCELAHR